MAQKRIPFLLLSIFLLLPEVALGQDFDQLIRSTDIDFDLPEATVTKSQSFDHGKLIARLEAIEAENAKLKAESIELRSVTEQLRHRLTPSETDVTDQATVMPVEQASFLSGSDACDCDPFGCDGCGDACTDCGKAGWFGKSPLCCLGFGKGGGFKAGAWKVTPFGRLRADVIYASEPYASDAVIVFLNPINPAVDEDAFSITAKQSQINFAVSGPSRNGWDTGGLILINFMGPQPLRNFSGANIVNAFGEIKNDRWRFAFGRMLDLFGPIAPRTVNQLTQRGSGDIGIYRGALNVDRFVTFNEAHRWKLSSRISQPDIPDYAAVPAINGQNNGWPNIEARIGVALGEPNSVGQPVEIGVSGLLGELQAVLPAAAGGPIFPGGIDEIEQTRGFCLDTQLRGETVGFRSEAWWGQAAGSYFVATLQSINPVTDQAIESVGGWGEFYLRAGPRLSTHVGYGADDPRDADLGAINPGGPGQIRFNDVAWWNAFYNVTDAFELGLEISYRRTKYFNPIDDNKAVFCHFSSTFNF